MRLNQGNFAVDRANGKVAGVCAGLAEATGFDATLIRVGFVLAVFMGGPLAIVAYAVLAFIGQPKRRYSESRLSRREERQARMRDFDLRMRAIETYAESSNSRLAREIEELR
jgi:phage shock protein C